MARGETRSSSRTSTPNNYKAPEQKDIYLYNAIMNQLGCKTTRPEFTAGMSGDAAGKAKMDFFDDRVKARSMVEEIVETWPDIVAHPRSPISDINLKKVSAMVVGIFAETLHMTERHHPKHDDRNTLNRGLVQSHNFADKNDTGLSHLLAEDIAKCNHIGLKYDKDKYKGFTITSLLDVNVNNGPISEIKIKKREEQTSYYTGLVMGAGMPISLYSQEQGSVHPIKGIKKNRCLEVYNGFIIDDQQGREWIIDFERTFHKRRDKDVLPVSPYDHGHMRAVGKTHTPAQSSRFIISIIKILFETSCPIMCRALYAAIYAVMIEVLPENRAKNILNIDDNESIGMFEAVIIRLSAFFICFHRHLLYYIRESPEGIGNLIDEINIFMQRILPSSRFFYTPIEAFPHIGIVGETPHIGRLDIEYKHGAYLFWQNIIRVQNKDYWDVLIGDNFTMGYNTGIKRYKDLRARHDDISVLDDIYRLCKTTIQMVSYLMNRNSKLFTLHKAEFVSTKDAAMRRLSRESQLRGAMEYIYTQVVPDGRYRRIISNVNVVIRHISYICGFCQAHDIIKLMYRLPAGGVKKKTF